jgi:hypothetical protein
LAIDLDRRALGAGALLCAAGAASAAQADAPTLNDPQRNLEAYIRMRGDLSGKPVFERVEGRTFGVVEKQLPKPLYGAVGIQLSRFVKAPEGFRFKFKYFSLCTDLATGAPIATLDNPYTGARNTIPPRLNDNPEILLTTEGWRFPNRPKDPGTQRNPGLVRPWTIVEDTLVLTDTLISPPRYEVHPAFQLFTYQARYRDAVNPRRTGVASSFAGTGMENWRDWMEIKDVDGSLCVHLAGFKVAGPASYPDWLVEAALKADPKFFDL